MLTNNPFWKNPIDTSNKIAKSMRTQLKIKAKENRSYVKRYLKFAKALQGNKFEDYSDYRTDMNRTVITETMNQYLAIQQKLNKI